MTEYEHVDNPVDRTVENEGDAATLVSAFFKVASALQLSDADMTNFLGLGTRRRLGELKAATPSAIRALTDAQLTRVAYFVGIYEDLEKLFSPPNVLNWLKNEAVPQDGCTRPWGAEAPLSHMMHAEGGIHDVNSYVIGMMNGL